MDDRDTFAAAALTGLLSNIPRYQLGVIAVQAYDIADEMLRERLRNGAAKSRENEHCRGVEELGRPRRAHNPEIAGSNPAAPTHDAVPEARARARDADRGRTDKAVARPGEDTGNTPSEAEIDALEFVVEEGRTASVDDYGILRSWLIRLRPEWESQSYEESNEKRTNTSTHRGIDRAAYEGDIVSRLRNWRGLHLAHSGDLFEEAASEIERLRTLATHATPREGSVQDGCTLTDEEREAVETAVRWLEPYPQVADKLRELLERLGGQT